MNQKTERESGIYEFPRLLMERIGRIVEDTPFISELQKRFFCTMLTQRKERILDFSLKKLQNRKTAQDSATEN